MGFELFPHADNGLQDTEGELPADNRGHPHDFLQGFLEPVDAGGDDPLDGIRYLKA